MEKSGGYDARIVVRISVNDRRRFTHWNRHHFRNLFILGDAF